MKNSLIVLSRSKVSRRTVVITSGEELFHSFRGGKNGSGGFIDACAAENLEPVPAIAANAMPGSGYQGGVGFI
jgi:hypothetical protein